MIAPARPATRFANDKSNSIERNFSTAPRRSHGGPKQQRETNVREKSATLYAAKLRRICDLRAANP
jgi:hypothetical protein